MDIQFRSTADETAAYSVGMQELSLPNVARSIPIGARFEDTAQPMVNLVRDIVGRQWHPQNGERFMDEIPFLLRRIHDCVWMHPIAEHDEKFDRTARYRFGLSRSVELVLKVAHLESEAVRETYRIDHFPGFSTSNGLGELHGLEVACFAERVGPRTTQILTTVADLAGKRDLRGYDRVAHAKPMYGIAGHILWPVGHLNPLDDQPKIELFDALPLYSDELDGFRADARQQQAWIDQRHSRRDVPAINARWGEIFSK